MTPTEEIIKGLNDDNEFWLSTDDDVKIIVSELSDDILLQTIYEQIEKDISIENNDILSKFEERYHYILMFYGNDTKILNSCKELRKNIYVKILNKICYKFDISTDLNSNDIDVNSENLYFYTKIFYEFFILNYRNNLIDFFVKYLYENSNFLVNKYKSLVENKNDLMIKSLKRSFPNSNHSYLIYLAENIILDFANSELSTEDLLEAITDTDPYEFVFNSIKTILLKNRFNTYCGENFVENFLKPIRDEEYRLNLLIEIKSNLVNMIKNNNKKEESSESNDKK